MGAARMGNKSICLPVVSEAAYEKLISDPPIFRRYLQLWIAINLAIGEPTG